MQRRSRRPRRNVPSPRFGRLSRSATPAGDDERRLQRLPGSASTSRLFAITLALSLRVPWPSRARLRLPSTLPHGVIPAPPSARPGKPPPTTPNAPTAGRAPAGRESCARAPVLECTHGGSMEHEFDRPRRKAAARPAPPVPYGTGGAPPARSDIDLVGAATTTGTAETLVQERNRPARAGDRPAGRARSRARDHLGRTRLGSGLTVIVLSGNEDRCVIDAALDCGRVRVRPEVGGAGRDRHGDPSAFEPSVYLARPTERTTAPAPDSELVHKLTRRELEILELVSGLGRTVRWRRSSGSPTRR